MRANTKDVRGTPYATVADTKSGTFVKVDDGFDCMKADETFKVEEDNHGTFIRCTDGRHGLDGQLSDDGTAYVGLYPSRPAESL